jgi:hypothetical protein
VHTVNVFTGKERDAESGTSGLARVSWDPDGHGTTIPESGAEGVLAGYPTAVAKSITTAMLLRGELLLELLLLELAISFIG